MWWTEMTPTTSAPPLPALWQDPPSRGPEMAGRAGAGDHTPDDPEEALMSSAQGIQRRLPYMALAGGRASLYRGRGEDAQS
jgi:hypothetical protein